MGCRDVVGERGSMSEEETRYELLKAQVESVFELCVWLTKHTKDDEILKRIDFQQHVWRRLDRENTVIMIFLGTLNILVVADIIIRVVYG